ncbi:MAG: homoserine O-acetyltransferase [Kiritimatiellae bacterium]|nr:homoserine O-acetyltransferase [Kiritimatiellia bacterium]
MDTEAISVGVVEPKTMELKLPPGGLEVAGGTLKKVEVRYETCGAPPRPGNLVFFCHALTGDAHVAGIRPGETKPSGWWENMVGPGRAVDTDKWHVVCANVLGGCSGTTGPGSINPDTGRPYGSAFPKYTFKDAVDVYRRFLQQLWADYGFDGPMHLAALIGGSYGGMQVVDWITRCPGEMDKALIIATAATYNTQALAFDVVGRSSITDDPEWHGGDYYAIGDGKGPKLGLAQARQLAHITYLSRELMQEKFGRRLQREFVEAPPEERKRREDSFKTYFQIESYLDYQGKKFLKRFDANTYLHTTRSLDMFDVAEEYGSLEAAMARVEAKCLVVSYGGDILFSAQDSIDMVHALLENGKSACYCHLESGRGHDSFLTDIEDLSGVVAGFLSPRKPRVMRWQKRLYRKVTAMVPKGAHVIDIGCGDGTLLNVIKAERGATGDGVEIDIDRYKEALADGNDMYWEDADEGLSIIPDGYYDTAVLSDTLQEVKNPRGLLREALRIANEAIVTFPNFAEYRIRLCLGFKGRLPVSKALPFQWYDTPNIHCVTLHDFRRLCDAEGYEIKEVRAESRHLLGKLLLFLGFKNLGAARIIARIGRK